MTIDTDAIRREAEEALGIAEKATPGLWGWRGHDDGSVELRALHSMGLRVISTQRSEPCLVSTIADADADYVDEVALTLEACDSCRAMWKKVGQTGNADLWIDYRCPKPENLDTVWLTGDGFIEPSNKWAVREQSYRSDVIDLDHPDARFIADSRTRVPALANELKECANEIDRLDELATDLLDVIFQASVSLHRSDEYPDLPDAELVDAVQSRLAQRFLSGKHEVRPHTFTVADSKAPISWGDRS